MTEEGTALVPARLLADTVKCLSDAPVEFESDQSQARIVRRVRGHAPAAAGRGLPVAAAAERHARRSSRRRGSPRRVGQVARAASRDEARPVLTGVLVEVNREGLTLVATDSYRLAVRELVASGGRRGEGDRPRARPDRGRAGRAGDREGRDRARDRREPGRRSSVGALTLTSRLIEGEFPNYRQLLPEPYENRLTVSRQQLLEAVRRVGLLARDTSPVRIEFNALGVQLSSSSPDLGQAVEAVEAQLRGRGHHRGVQPRLPGRRSRAATGDSVQLEVRDGLKPAIVRGESDEFTYLVMPVRLPDAGRLAGPPLRLAVGGAPGLPQPRRDAARGRSRGPRRRSSGRTVRGRRTCSRGSRSCSSSRPLGRRRPSPLVRRGAEAAYVRGRGRDGERAHPRGGRDPGPRRQPRPGQPLDRCGASATFGARSRGRVLRARRSRRS